MKIFVSSRFTGMETFRLAARTAIGDLGHEPLTVEDFPARTQTPQQACLDGVRQSGLVVLLLGESYGALQKPSGLSATHEEYREARATRDVLVFLQEGMEPEPAQASFIKEVSDWSAGGLRQSFRTAEDLRSKVTRAISQWQLARAAGPVDEAALVSKARALIPAEQRNTTLPHGPRVVLTIASGPTQAVLRPSELEAPTLHEAMQQAAMFGPVRIFMPAHGSTVAIEGNSLRLRQGDRSDVLLDPEGAIRLRLTLPERERGAMYMGAVIHEEVGAVLTAALAYAVWMMDRVDPTMRLTHSAVAVTLSNAESATWRTQQERDASPNSMSMRGYGRVPQPVMLTPPVLPRAALRNESSRLVEDLLTLMRREWRAQ